MRLKADIGLRFAEEVKRQGGEMIAQYVKSMQKVHCFGVEY